jgi:hypothetical protein
MGGGPAVAKDKSTDSSDEGDDFLDRQFQCDQDDAERYYTFSDRVIDKLQGLGVGNMPIPELRNEHDGIFNKMKAGSYFDGRLPTTIRKLSFDQLSATLTLVTDWYTYIMQQAMLIEAELSEAKRQKEFMWALVRTRIKDTARSQGKKISDVLASDLAKIDSRFVKVDAIFIEKDTLNNCMQAMLRSAGHNLKTVSREITIRQIKEEAEARARGLGSSAGDRPMSRFTQYKPADPGAGLPGLDGDDNEETQDEGEAAEPEERRSATPSKAKGPTPRARPRKLLHRPK